MLKNVINYAKSLLPWRPWPSFGNTGLWFGGPRKQTAIASSDQALTIGTYFAGLRKYQTIVASLPLVTYRDDGGSREEFYDHPAHDKLKLRPNPCMSRHTFMQQLVYDVFQHGDFFCQIQWANNHKVLGLYPIPPYYVENIVVDDDWRKTYVVNTADGRQFFPQEDILHVFYHSRLGIRGVPLWLLAAESLGLARQVLDAAGAYYAHAAQPSGYIKYPGRVDDQTLKQMRDQWDTKYGGPEKAGHTAILQNGGDYVRIPASLANDAKIVEALGLDAANSARWWNLSPFQLGDYSAAHYNSLGADNNMTYQNSYRPFLDCVEQEFNEKLFNDDRKTYCRFDTGELLRGDSFQQAQINQIGITSGYLLRSEAREAMDLPHVPGMDQPLFPLNMGGSPGQKSEQKPQPQKEVTDESDDQDQGDDADAG